jgi:hypothetical protein
MALSRTDISKAVCSKFRERDMETPEGPIHAGPFVIYRIWTEWGKGPSWDCQAHYAVENGGKLEIFEDFSDFGAWLSNEFGHDQAANRRERLIRIVVASIIVLGAFAVFAFTALQNPQQTLLGYIATAIIGGGAGFLFGNWSRPTASVTPPPS